MQKPKLTQRQQFLQEMARVIPWALWISRIAPHDPTAGPGPGPVPLETMLRIHLLQQWFGSSDPAMEEALHDLPMPREFAGWDAGEEAMPDETTILKFRHRLEAHGLAQTLVDETVALLAAKGLLPRQGTIVEATLIPAPSATKNPAGKRGPDMTSTKKGSNYSFGMKAHTGVDAASGLVHTVAVTTAKVADGVMTDALLHGEEEIVSGDRAYIYNDRNPDAEPLPGEPVWAFPFKRKPGQDLPAEQAKINRWLASVRAAVEHPFRLVKRQFGYAKVRYRGLYKNGQPLFLLFALGNLFHMRGFLRVA